MAAIDSWSDDPLIGIQGDTFGREPFARLLAQTIDRIQVGSASTVFGLVGRWGSGKSSVAVMVGELLPDSWIVQPFTPWAATGTSGLQLEFVAALDAALGGELAEEEAAKIALQKYAKWVSPVLSVLPGIGNLLATTAQTAVDELSAREPWSAEFEALADLLQAMEKRVLIVCDDIDRLDARELLEFLKVVRLLGRFPNVHYLVAYDADAVEDLLAAEGVGGRTSSFMEKIVQHPFELPKIDEATRWKHISDAMLRSLDDQGVELDESRLERYRLLLDTLTIGLVTPRQIARYESHLRVLSALVPGEVDFLDFAALANLRLNHHEVYEALPDWAPELRIGLKGGTNDKGLTEQEWISRIDQVSRRPDITGAWETICFLFPDTRSSRQGSVHPQAFSNAGYLERYYSLGVPENDVSDVLVARAVKSLLDREPDSEAEATVLNKISTGHPTVARVFVEKLRDYRKTLLGEPDKVAKIVRFLFSEYKRVEPRRYDPGSSLDITFDWLSDEVFRGYTGGEFTREVLIELFGEELALSLLLRVSWSLGSSHDERMKEMLSDFADYFLDALAGEGVSALEPFEYLRLKLSLVTRAKGGQAIAGLLDQKVDGDIGTFESVAMAMVRTENWVGSGTVRQNLNFEATEWTAVISADVRERMAAELTAEFDSEPIDTSDISDSNRRRLAIVKVRSEFGLVGHETDNVK